MNDQKSVLRNIVKSRLNQIVTEMNSCLSGESTFRHKENLLRLSSSSILPHWYIELEKNGVLPNLDGKTVGSVLEQILVSSIQLVAGNELPLLNVNPAKGVDIPELDLGIKSPSENYCTSEPFFSAYERLIGSEYDVVVVLTDYQTAKKTPPLKLQIKSSRYLFASQLADKNLCMLARLGREFMKDKNEAELQKLYRFLAFVNQGDWRARALLSLIPYINDSEKLLNRIDSVQSEYEKTNILNAKTGKEPIDQLEIDSITSIKAIQPTWLGLLSALDNWTIENQKDFARFPNESELNKLRSGELDGQIGMSYALQWRYNFGALFRNI